MGADQPFNAARCEDLGVGIALNAEQLTPKSVADTVAAVVLAPSYREAAERIQAEIAALPTPFPPGPPLEGRVPAAADNKY